MALSVFPELMDKIDPQDPDSSLRTIENYINYMVERVEFSLTNTFRTTTSLGSSAEAVALVLEDTVNKLSEASSQLAILQGVVNDLLHDIRDYETLDNKPQIASVELVGDKSLAQLGIASQADQTALEGRVSALETTGGEPNVIETVKRNGAALPVTDKAVDVTVPTKVSDLTNDSGYQTAGQVQAALEAGLASLLAAETYGPSPVASFDAGAGGLPVKSCRVTTAAGSGSVNVYRTGKNLVDQKQYTASNVVWAGDVATWTVASGTNYAMLRVPAIRLLAGVTYTASCRIRAVSKDPNYAPRIVFRTTAWAIVKHASMGASETEAVVSCTYTPSADVYMYIGIMGTGPTGGGCQLDVSQLQLEVGSSRTDYDPYRGGVWTYDPATDSLTPPVMSSVPGVNCIWSDGGDVTVEYGAFLAALQAEIEALQ